MNDTKICTVCETGRKDYLLDKSSVFCSYISCLKHGKCGMFKPLVGDFNEKHICGVK